MSPRNSCLSVDEDHVAGEKPVRRMVSTTACSVPSAHGTREPLVLQSAESASFQLRTHGEIEAHISNGMSRFEQEFMGRGPKAAHAYLIDDLVVIRLEGVLTPAE